MVNKPCLLGMVQEEDEQQKLLELEGLNGILVSWPVAVGHSGVGVSSSNVWVVQESGQETERKGGW